LRINQYTLDEWSRPSFSEFAMIPFWLILTAFLVLLLHSRRRLWHLTTAEATIYACALALLPGAILAVRNVGPFVMVAVPAITWLLAAGQVRQVGPRKERAALNLAVAVAAGFAVVSTLVSAYRGGADRLRWNPVPVGALLALNACPDNLYNRYDEGGPLMWFAQGRKVFLDGRQDPYPPELVLAHIQMETGQTAHEPTFRKFGIRCAYLPNTSPVAQNLTATGWTPLYRDATWVVFRDPTIRGSGARSPKEKN
jgi:hypothetical protein